MESVERVFMLQDYVSFAIHSTGDAAASSSKYQMRSRRGKSCRLAPPSLGRLHQPIDRVVVLDERRLDDDVAEILLDADIAFQQALDDFLVVVHAARDELQQVVVAAADQMAFDDFVDRTDAGLEFDEVLALVVLQ